MYNPSRGGVRGGADQFTWESVKNDKHRENYLGHSLMAPVGRWQKGKDLSWYAKERKDTDKSEKSELASIKQAEEEAMLIALGHNVVRKTQTLSKEEMREALKRNAGERDDHNIERIDGVGASSQRVALLSGVGKDSRQKSEGVAFEGYRERKEGADKNDNLLSEERKKMKKSKKHKKEKKHKKHREESSDSVSSDSDNRNSSKILKSQKEKKHKKRHIESPDSDSSDCDERKSKTRNEKEKKHKKYHKASYDSDSPDANFSKLTSKHKRDEFDSDNERASEVKSQKQKKHKKHHKETHDSDSNTEQSYTRHRAKHKRDESDSDGRNYSNHKDRSNYRSRKSQYSKSNNEDYERYKKQTNVEKRHRHDTSESD